MSNAQRTLKEICRTRFAALCAKTSSAYACLPSNPAFASQKFKKAGEPLLTCLFGRGDGIRALSGHARTTAQLKGCRVVGSFLRHAQAKLACLPSNPAFCLSEIQKGRRASAHLPFWSRRRDSNPRPYGPEPYALPTALRLDC